MLEQTLKVILCQLTVRYIGKTLMHPRHQSRRCLHKCKSRLLDCAVTCCCPRALGCVRVRCTRAAQVDLDAPDCVESMSMNCSSLRNVPFACCSSFPKKPATFSRTAPCTARTTVRERRDGPGHNTSTRLQQLTMLICLEPMPGTYISIVVQQQRLHAEAPSEGAQQGSAKAFRY